MLLRELVDTLLIKDVNGSIEIPINDIQIDSRKIKKGDLFIALSGHTVDGHDFINKAIENGAVAILAEKEHIVPEHITYIRVSDTRRAMAYVSSVFFNYPSSHLNLIGITGTNGKTTTTNLINAIFQEAGLVTGLIGTIHNKIGDIIEEAVNTTPESLELQRLLYRMKNKNVSHVIMEVSSHALVQGRVRGCDFNAAIFSNLTQDHLDYHHTMDEYKQAKSLLFSQLGNNVNGRKFSILNNDDEVSKYYNSVSTAEVVSYGIKNISDFQAVNLSIGPNGSSFDLISPLGKYRVESKLIGKFNIYNLLSAIAVSFTQGIPMDVILTAIKKVEGVNGRFEPIFLGQNFTTIIDFAHTPDSLENVLSTITNFSNNSGSIYTLIGCGGDRDKTKRPIMASIAEKYSDFVILTSDNPRHESPEAILDDMEKGITGSNYKRFVDRKDAIEFVINHASENDIILIAGKGHENYQIIGDTKHHFSDKEIASEYIQNLILKK